MLEVSLFPASCLNLLLAIFFFPADFATAGEPAPTHAGIIYAPPGPGHLLDLYLPPTQTGKVPVVLWTHVR